MIQGLALAGIGGAAAELADHLIRPLGGSIVVAVGASRTLKSPPTSSGRSASRWALMKVISSSVCRLWAAATGRSAPGGAATNWRWVLTMSIAPGAPGNDGSAPASPLAGQRNRGRRSSGKACPRRPRIGVAQHVQAGAGEPAPALAGRRIRARRRSAVRSRVPPPRSVECGWARAPSNGSRWPRPGRRSRREKPSWISTTSGCRPLRRIVASSAPIAFRALARPPASGQGRPRTL